jgi:peptidoglycan/xylan/chitin deacetylase (PgdA/CDA1 family)
VRISLGLPDEEMRALHAGLLDACEVMLPEKPIQAYQPLSWDQIREADAQGIEIGAHTKTHPALSRVEGERLREEIMGSKQRIEQMLGHRIVSFCYPNGTSDDVTEDVKRTVAEAGFWAAPVAYFDERVTNDAFELRRYPVGAWRRKFLQALHGVDLLSMRMRAGKAAQATVGSQ